MKEAKFILVHAGVRYWEDATVNGVEDEDGSLIPGRHGDEWRFKIELETGKLVDWPAGAIADVHYKVCDDGSYWLLDGDGNKIARREGYVPNTFLCHGDNGYGDYIIMKINGDGQIEDYRRPKVVPSDWEAA